MTSTKSLILSLLLSAAVVSSRLVAYGPQELKDKFSRTGTVFIIELTTVFRW